LKNFTFKKETLPMLLALAKPSRVVTCFFDDGEAGDNLSSDLLSESIENTASRSPRSRESTAFKSDQTVFDFDTLFQKKGYTIASIIVNTCPEIRCDIALPSAFFEEKLTSLEREELTRFVTLMEGEVEQE
jgi:hypothetical protein